jgi:hypothetical protein
VESLFEKARFKVQNNLYLILMLRSIRTLSDTGIPVLFYINSMFEKYLTRIYNQFK